MTATATSDRQRILDLIDRRCALALKSNEDAFNIAFTYLRYLRAEIASGLTAAEIDANSAATVDYNALHAIPATALRDVVDAGWQLCFSRDDAGRYRVTADGPNGHGSYTWRGGTPEEAIMASFGQVLLQLEAVTPGFGPS